LLCTLVVIHAMVALFRPHPPKAAAVAANLTKAKDLENSDSIGGTNKTSEIPKDVSSEVEAADDDDDQQEQHPTKSKLRSAWEWKRRILGMILAMSSRLSYTPLHVKWWLKYLPPAGDPKLATPVNA